MNPDLELLLKTLRLGERTAQAEAARLLGEAAVPDAVPALLEYVDTSRQFHKSAGFTALGRIGDPSVCDRIHLLANDNRMRNDWYWFGWRSVQAAAAHALLLLGDERGGPILAAFAEKRDDVFYSWFAPAILQLENHLPVIAELKSLLTVERLFSVPENSTRLSDPSRLTAVVDALGWIGGPDAANKALEFIDHRSRYVRGQAVLSAIRAGGLEAFGSFGERLLRDDPTSFVQAKAAVSLEDTGVLVVLARNTSEPFDRAVAVEGLGVLRALPEAPCALEATRDEDPYVRQCALEALERMGSGESVPAAKKALADQALNVRCQAAKTLIVMGRDDRNG